MYACDISSNKRKVEKVYERGKKIDLSWKKEPKRAQIQTQRLQCGCVCVSVRVWSRKKRICDDETNASIPVTQCFYAENKLVFGIFNDKSSSLFSFRRLCLNFNSVLFANSLFHLLCLSYVIVPCSEKKKKYRQIKKKSFVCCKDDRSALNNKRTPTMLHAVRWQFSLSMCLSLLLSLAVVPCTSAQYDVFIIANYLFVFFFRMAKHMHNFLFHVVRILSTLSQLDLNAKM